MGTLNEDLNRWQDELFTKGDLKAGLKAISGNWKRMGDSSMKKILIGDAIALRKAAA